MKKLSLVALGIAVFGITAAATFNTGVVKSDSKQDADCWENPDLEGAPTLVQADDCPNSGVDCCYKRENPSNPNSQILEFAHPTK